MKSQKGQYLYIIDRIAGQILYVVACLAVVLFVLFCFGFSCKYVWYLVGGLFAACVLCRICLSPFVKSEEEEEFEQKIEYVLQQKQEKKQERTFPVQEDIVQTEYTPLRDLTPKQEKQVMQLLRDLPANPKRPEYINLAILAQYLTALEELGKARLVDKYNLRLWAAQVTGKKMPSTSQFNDAIPSKMKPKITAASKKVLQIIR